MKKSILFFIPIGIVILSCSKIEKADIEKPEGLKDTFQQYFPIGVAVSPRSLHNTDSVLIKTEFNSMTAENAMKMGPLQPEPGVFNWKDADELVDFAQKNKIRVRGHALCWHEQAPNWMFTDDEGYDVTKEELLSRLKIHIEAIVGRYKGKIYAWDVVNEAISDDNSKFLRDSKWYQICGEDFIIKAFEYAHAADPEALLFYNDYNADYPEKRERIYRLLKLMVDKGVPIDGLGMQGHWSLTNPTESDLRDAIDRYSSLGLQIQITELDVSIYPWEKNKREIYEGEVDELTPELEQTQIKQYEMFFRVFKEKKDVISGITFWGVSDKQSWLNNHPVSGRRNYPLLFDRNQKRKKVYNSITLLQ